MKILGLSRNRNVVFVVVGIKKEGMVFMEKRVWAGEVRNLGY